MPNLERDHLCGWNDCIFYAKHKGTCRTASGDYINGPRATVEICPCENCSPVMSDSPLQLLWERLCVLVRADMRVTYMHPDYAKELQRAVDAYIYRKCDTKNGELESIVEFMERTNSMNVTNGEFALELANREKVLIEKYSK